MMQILQEESGEPQANVGSLKKKAQLATNLQKAIHLMSIEMTLKLSMYARHWICQIRKWCMFQV